MVSIGMWPGHVANLSIQSTSRKHVCQCYEETTTPAAHEHKPVSEAGCIRDSLLTLFIVVYLVFFFLLWLILVYTYTLIVFSPPGNANKVSISGKQKLVVCANSRLDSMSKRHPVRSRLFRCRQMCYLSHPSQLSYPFSGTRTGAARVPNVCLPYLGRVSCRGLSQ